MLVAAALCPATPLLLEGVTGQLDPVPDLRRACAQAVSWLIRHPGPGSVRPRVVVLGSAEVTATYRADLPFSVGGFTGEGTGDGAGEGVEDGTAERGRGGTGDDTAGCERLPVPLGIGRQLLFATGGLEPSRHLVYQTIATEADPVSCCRLGNELAESDESTVLLVLDDGILELPDGFPYRYGPGSNAGFCAASSAASGADSSGAATLRVCASAMCTYGPSAEAGATTWPARVHYRDDPYLIPYLVVTWSGRQLSTGNP